MELTNNEFLEIERKLGDMVAQYTTAIHRISPNDDREPPGDLHGTGNLIQIEELKYLLTCEHVAKFIKRDELCIAFRNEGIVFGLANPASALLDPADIAIVGISDNDWECEPHEKKCIQLAQLADRHSPMEGEWMYISGYPGELAHAWPPMPDEIGRTQESGQQHFTAISFMCQIREEFDDELSNEHPRPLEDMHFLLPYSPEIVEYMSEGPDKVLPLPPGLSGSLVWNTRYVEVTSSGRAWEPEDARITGIIWGGSSKSGVLVATPVGYIWQLIDSTISNIKAGRPYWNNGV
ncbi:hypothetical protein F3J44_24235 [Pantoea sp. Tr-811]|uniref:hypothetical protein n=1 Tax=Pantoea sp. Tr-811 TaxID=2608361 RepID=UPI00141EF282|nr:hypothetical protein [Pantoea sp. Tr-811]NIF29463.1 hypothetical protein [Pantoea sp. Tr-811]